MKHFDLFLAFCQEPIYADKGVYNIDKRKEVFFDFCRFGIIPLLESEGYVLGVNEHELCLRILQVLWHLKNKRNVIPIRDNNMNYNEEHYRVYNDTFDYLVWDKFWKRWDGIQDWETPYGELFKHKLPDLLWSWLDLPSCSRTDEIENYLYEDEQQEQMARRRDDPYLVDYSQVDYQDRHKH